MTHVLLATPTAMGTVTQQYLHFAVQLKDALVARGNTVTISTRADGLVTRARNGFAATMLADESITHLLMVDADNTVEPATVIRLLQSGHDLVGVGIPYRRIRWDHLHEALTSGRELTVEQLQAISHDYSVWFDLSPEVSRVPVDGFLPVRAVGTGVLLASRRVFQTLRDSGRVDHYATGGGEVQPSGWTFFDPYVDPEGTYLSEDYALCARWRACGEAVWVDLTASALHAGPVEIRGNLMTSIRAQQHRD